MLFVPADLDPASVPPGSYAVWGGRDLRAEIPAIATLLRAMTAGNAVAARIVGAEGAGAAWAGDPLVPAAGAVDRPGLLALLTSGTTGAPKAVEIDVRAAFERKRGGRPGERWLLSYAPWRWAGISVLLHAIRFGSEVVVPRSFDPTEVVAAGREFGATHLSLTPSLFRMLRVGTAAAQLAGLPLCQVTFGGEQASQAVLDGARELWPAARITHTYASSEFGDICAVSDGLAGVPARKFEGFEWSPAGELTIGGRQTGDLWERRGDRFYFAGRAEEMINVGGAKVSPLTVEEAALAVPGVRLARARGVPSPVMGQLVALDYVGEAAESELREALLRRLPRVACPAVVAKRDSIDLSEAGKLRRLV